MRPELHDAEAERAFLNGLFLSSLKSVQGALLALEQAKLHKADFHTPRHAALFEVAQELLVGGQPFDALTVLTKYAGTQLLEECGGRPGVLAALAADDFLFDAEPLKVAPLLRDLGQRRLALEALTTTARRLYSRDVPLSETLNPLKASLDSFSLHTASVRSVADMVEEMIGHVEDVSAGKKEPVQTWGLPSVDNLTAGAQATLIILAGLPGTGKNAIMAASAQARARLGLRTGIVSLEDADLWLGWRLLADESRLSQSKLRFRKLSQWELEHRFTPGLEKVYNAGRHVFVADGSTDSHGIDSVLAMATDLVVRHKCQMLWVDNVTEIEVKNGEQRPYELGNFAKRLRHLANKFGVPVVLLSHLKRRQGLAPGDRAQATDIQDSSGLERRARMILQWAREEGSDKGTLHNLKANNSQGAGKSATLEFMGLSAMVKDLGEMPNGEEDTQHEEGQS